MCPHSSSPSSLSSRTQKHHNYRGYCPWGSCAGVGPWPAARGARRCPPLAGLGAACAGAGGGSEPRPVVHRQGPWEGTGTSSQGPLGSPSSAGVGCAVEVRGRIRLTTAWHEARHARRSTTRQHDTGKNSNEEQRRERSHRRRRACRRSRAHRRRRGLGSLEQRAAGVLGWGLHAGLGVTRAIPKNAWLWAVCWCPGWRISSSDWRREVARQASGTDAGTQVGGRDAGAWAQRCAQGGAAARQRRPWPPAGGVDEAETRSGGRRRV
jgi:hypothetical protein